MHCIIPIFQIRKLNLPWVQSIISYHTAGRAKIWLVFLALQFIFHDALCTNNTSSKQIAWEALYQKLGPSQLSPPSVDCGNPKAHCVNLIGSTSMVGLRLPLSLSLMLLMARLVKNLSRKVSSLPLTPV